MIEFELEKALAREKTKSHRNAVTLLKHVLKEVKNRGFEDPPIGTEPKIPISDNEFQGPIETAIFISFDYQLGESPYIQFAGSSKLTAAYSVAESEFGLIDKEQEE